MRTRARLSKRAAQLALRGGETEPLVDRLAREIAPHGWVVEPLDYHYCNATGDVLVLIDIPDSPEGLLL
jgi:hypothetical protein